MRTFGVKPKIAGEETYSRAMKLHGVDCHSESLKTYNWEYYKDLMRKNP